ncbi:hypothetical protein B0H63DRAFT_540478 [Podospora didyma]|uniref:Uncharacterized protein n=1 Tax=Podospora didyma TaxID=330526 RepID=A0AAE0NRU7_9PEZI|nr:hypothetical protein B0H63DRAFT_540478 [Podospora didyma]
MTTEEPQWDAVTEAEIALKKAFSDLKVSGDSALVPGTDTTPNRFILHTKGYYDLRAYVLSGKEFPRTPAAFQAKMPKAAFAKLTAIDSTIYDKTLETMVAIGSTCTEYHNSNLAKLVTAATEAANFSDNTIALLSDAEGINLKDHLNVLLDPKYKGSTTFDDAFYESKEAAQFTLTLLKADAEEKELEVKDVINTMIAFKENTMSQLTSVVFLDRQYNTGPVTNSSTVKTPYVQYLNAELATAISSFYATLKQAQDVWGRYEKARDIAIGVAFVPFGWIGSIIKGQEATNLQNEYNALIAKSTRLQQEWAEGEALINLVTRLTRQCDDIDDKMEAAIDAMVELAKLFTAQAKCYDGISNNLDGMHTGTDALAAANRKAYINYNLGECLKRLKELKLLAEEFAEAIIRDVSLTTGDVSA